MALGVSKETTEADAERARTRSELMSAMAETDDALRRESDAAQAYAGASERYADTLSPSALRRLGWDGDERRQMKTSENRMMAARAAHKRGFGFE